MKIIITPVRKLLLCAVVGAFVFAVAEMHFAKKKREIAEKQTFVTVVRSRKYIGEGKPIALDFIEEFVMPEAYVTPTMVKKCELMDRNGHTRFKARVGIPKGEILSKSTMLDEQSALGPAWSLEPRQTAFGLRLNAEDAVGGLLKPGDWVHLVFTSSKRASILVPRVRVLSIADQVWDGSRAISDENLAKPMATDSILVTLILAPEDLLVARLAAMHGQLTLSLISPLCDDLHVPRSIELKELELHGGRT